MLFKGVLEARKSPPRLGEAGGRGGAIAGRINE